MPERYGPLRIVNVDGLSVRMWLETYDPLRRRFYDGWDDLPIVFHLEELMHEEIRIFGPSVGRIWSGPGDTYCRYRVVDYVYDPFHQRIDVTASLKKFQHLADVEYIRKHAPSFFRTTERTALFRGELEAASRRWRAIHDCKHIKEELMAAVWHPRRVEALLETHGWAAYNNLLGEE